jgi:hypothetical protein
MSWHFTTEIEPLAGDQPQVFGELATTESSCAARRLREQDPAGATRSTHADPFGTCAIVMVTRDLRRG